jgi:hypothetical protein
MWMGAAIGIAAIGAAACAWSGRPAEAVVLLVFLLVAVGVRRMSAAIRRVEEQLEEIQAMLVVK